MNISAEDFKRHIKGAVDSNIFEQAQPKIDEYAQSAVDSISQQSEKGRGGRG